MTPDEINKTIAVLLGYRLELRRYARGWWIAPNNYASMSPPDYYSSLDACAEFERSLTRSEMWDYQQSFCESNSEYDADEYHVTLIKLTAPQRCEAYLKVKGLWK